MRQDVKAFFRGLCSEPFDHHRNGCLVSCARWVSQVTGRDWRPLIPAFDDPMELDIPEEFRRIAAAMDLRKRDEARPGDVGLISVSDDRRFHIPWTGGVCLGRLWLIKGMDGVMFKRCEPVEIWGLK